MTIDMLNKRDDGAKMVIQDIILIDVGDTITWVPTFGLNVESGSYDLDIPRNSMVKK